MPKTEIEFSQGRIIQGPPIGMIDIGSNSVRLVVYEGLARSPTVIFNEKALCGLGRSLATTGRLDPAAVERALMTLKRYRTLCDTLNVKKLHVVATAAARDAKDGAAFIDRATKICRVKIDVLSGKREAKLSALGVVSGFYKPDGVVGDMGGGSLELIEVKHHRVGGGITTRLGGLALQDAAKFSVKAAEKMARTVLGKSAPLKKLEGRTFYAVGGTWRSLAKLHMKQIGYPLHVMHGYTVPARDMMELCRLVARVDAEALIGREAVAPNRRALLAYGAVVMEAIMRIGKPKDVVISALGVREGLLYSLLSEKMQRQDPLIAAASELNLLRSRSPRHGEELVAWTDRFIASAHLDETAEEERLRHAACLVADIGWRTHPDYRGEQSLNIIANGSFIGIDHAGRAYMALANYYRHAGLTDEDLSPRILEIASPHILYRARILGAAMRLAYIISASMPGVLPCAPLKARRGQLVLELSPDLAGLAGERLTSRLKQLGRLIGHEPMVTMAREARNRGGGK